MVDAEPSVKAVVEVIPREDAVVKVPRDEAVSVEVPDKVVVVFVRVVVEPRVTLVLAPESKMSFPLTCKSSLTARVPPDKSSIYPSILKFPDLSKLATVVPEADAVKIFWSPVSFKLTKAFPVCFPFTSNWNGVVLFTPPNTNLEFVGAAFPGAKLSVPFNCK